MKKVSILVPEKAVLAAVGDPRTIFSAINDFMAAEGKPPVFDISLVGLTREVRLHDNIFSVHTDATIDQVKETDLVFIPALSGDMDIALEHNRGMLPWIRKQYENGAEVASLCIGAFLLAETGLLSGKKCSTHWGYAHEFRRRYPDVELVDGSIVTEENGIYSSGGATSYFNLLLYLIEKFVDRATAIRAAKYFAIDIERATQSQFVIFQGQKNHDDDAVRRAQEFIEANVEQRITIDQLAGHVAVGRRTFERRFRKATNNSVNEYLQRVKMEAAKRSFETSRKNIGEVMFDVGYTDTKAFREVFKKVTGLTPIEYRNKYNRQAVEVPEAWAAPST